MFLTPIDMTLSHSSTYFYESAVVVHGIHLGLGLKGDPNKAD